MGRHCPPPLRTEVAQHTDALWQPTTGAHRGSPTHGCTLHVNTGVHTASPTHCARRGEGGRGSCTEVAGEAHRGSRGPFPRPSHLFSPKSAEVHFGPPKHPVFIGLRQHFHFGRLRGAKVLQKWKSALLLFWTSIIGPYAGEYSLFQKVTFCKNIFCENFQKIVHFSKVRLRQ